MKSETNAAWTSFLAALTAISLTTLLAVSFLGSTRSAQALGGV